MGCAIFHDLLKPSAILRPTLQDKDLSIVDAIEAVMKTNKSIEQLKSNDLDQFPTVKTVIYQVQDTHLPGGSAAPL